MGVVSPTVDEVEIRLLAIAERAEAAVAVDPRTANSAVLALSRRPGQLPLTMLARLAVTVKNKALRTRLQAALANLGALRGWSMAEVMELAVDDHGLGADGRLVENLGEYEAVVEVLADKARLSFARAGHPLKGVPVAVTEAHGDRLRQLRVLVKEIGKTVTAERQRVESLLSDERVWTYQEWVARYLEHPATGTFGRRLLWETTVDGAGWRAGLPSRRADGWVLLGPDGAPARGERIWLWHPIRAGTRHPPGLQDPPRLGKHPDGAERLIPVHRRGAGQDQFAAPAVRGGPDAVHGPVEGIPARRRRQDHRRDHTAADQTMTGRATRRLISA